MLSHKIMSAALLCFALFIIALLNTPTPPKVEVTTQPVVQDVAVSAFDVPSLLYKNIDEIVAVLGEPQNDSELTDLQMQAGNDEWSKDFTKSGYVLMVTYHVKNRSVIDFFVSASDEIYNNRDKEKLFQLTNTNEADNRYSISFVAAMKDPSRFTGILIKAK